MNHDSSFGLAIKVEVQEKMHVENFSQASNTFPKMCECKKVSFKHFLEEKHFGSSNFKIVSKLWNKNVCSKHDSN